jgi:polyphenol oxidase
MQALEFIYPSWPAPANVKSLQTTRIGGISVSPFDSLNLAMHVQDDAFAVARNRQLLADFMPTEPVWINQVHGVDVIDAAKSSCLETADGSFSKQKNVVCVAMTADCLPVLLCDKAGSVVAAVHAGWRGLCDGVLEAAVAQMPVAPNTLMAWLGPAIGPTAFEVGEEVRAQFVTQDEKASAAFIQNIDKTNQDKLLGNLYLIAQQRLNNVGVTDIYGGGIDEDFCTFTDEKRFFSFRRDNVTGRMATMIWLT